jgi:hypothetical protein
MKTPERPKSPTYQVRIKGHLNGGWSEWFEDFTITTMQDGTTLLTGAVDDQSALHGLLMKTRDLGLVLLSVNQVDVGDGDPIREDIG